jgi:hypothetical protein
MKPLREAAGTCKVLRNVNLCPLEQRPDHAAALVLQPHFQVRSLRW